MRLGRAMEFAADKGKSPETTAHHQICGWFWDRARVRGRRRRIDSTGKTCEKSERTTKSRNEHVSSLRRIILRTQL